MKLVVCESPVRARTIWNAIGGPEDTVVCHLDPDTIGLNPKTAVDETQGFAPIWGIVDERAFRPLARQARKAETILLAHRDDWAASVLEDTLRSTGITAPINRVVIHDLWPNAVKVAFQRPVQINREHVARVWRRETADRMVGDAVQKALKKIDIQWAPGMREVQMLRWISQANRGDVEGLQYDVPPSAFDVHSPSLFGALLRGSEQQPTEEVARQIGEMLDGGLLSDRSPAAVASMIRWSAENLGSDQDSIMNGMDMLIPMDAAIDLRTIIPAHRAVYTDIWQHAIRALVPKHAVKPIGPVGKWLGEVSQLICYEPILHAVTIGKLREAGMVWGWSYVQLTERGMLVDATMQAAFPTLADWASIAGLIQNVDDHTILREASIGSVATALQNNRTVEMPMVATMCPKCRASLKLRLTGRSLRAACQESTCGTVWPVEQDWTIFRPLLPHEAPRWCKQCSGIQIHAFSMDESTRSTRQTCKSCETSSTH